MYAEALRQNMTVMANPWGLPGDLDGPVAAHALALGAAMVETLAPLPDHEGELRQRLP